MYVGKKLVENVVGIKLRLNYLPSISSQYHVCGVTHGMLVEESLRNVFFRRIQFLSKHQTDMLSIPTRISSIIVFIHSVFHSTEMQ